MDHLTVFKCLFGRGHRDQGGAQHAFGDQVTLLQHRHDGVGLLLGGHHADGLVLSGVKFGPGGGVDGDDLVALERCRQLAQRGVFHRAARAAPGTG